MRPVADPDVKPAPNASTPPPASAPAPVRDATPAAGEPAPLGDEARRPMRPIGPDALRALREAIRSGRYPSEDVVRDGLERLIRRPR